MVIEAPAVTEWVYNPSRVLGDSDLTGGSVSGADGSILTGTWSLEKTGIIPTADNKGYTAVFTPDDTTRYEKVTGIVTVNVQKAVPVIKVKPVAAEITYGKKLSEAVLSGGAAVYGESDGTAVSGSFRWLKEDTLPTVADSNITKFAVVFVPSDTVNYQEVQTELTVAVHKAASAPNIPEKTISVPNSKEKVGDIPLPDGWVWQDSDKDIILNVNETVNATAIYIGNDKGNYETESIVISITRQEDDESGEDDESADNTGKNGSTVPNTGDSSPLAVQWILMLGSAVAIMGMGIFSVIDKKKYLR